MPLFSTNKAVGTLAVIILTVLVAFILGETIYRITDILFMDPIDLRLSQPLFWDNLQATTYFVIIGILQVAQSMFILSLLVIAIPLIIILARLRVLNPELQATAKTITDRAFEFLTEHGNLTGFDWSGSSSDNSNQSNTTTPTGDDTMEAN